MCVLGGDLGVYWRLVRSAQKQSMRVPVMVYCIAQRVWYSAAHEKRMGRRLTVP